AWQAPTHSIGGNRGSGVRAARDDGQAEDGLPADTDLVFGDHVNPSQDEAVLLVANRHGGAGDPEGDETALYANNCHSSTHYLTCQTLVPRWPCPRGAYGVSRRHLASERIPPLPAGGGSPRCCAHHGTAGRGRQGHSRCRCG